jgi:hypothetical protein
LLSSSFRKNRNRPWLKGQSKRLCRLRTSQVQGYSSKKEQEDKMVLKMFQQEAKIVHPVIKEMKYLVLVTSNLKKRKS